MGNEKKLNFFLQLSGMPGAGKSTLARQIAQLIPVVIIDHDVTKSALMEAGIPEQTAGPAAYTVDYAYVEFELSLGHNVIMDSPCAYDFQLEKSIAAAANNNATYRYIEYYLSDMDEIDRRLKNRNRKISQWMSTGVTEAEREAFASSIDNMKKPATHYLVVDTVRPVQEYIDEVMKYLLSDE